MYESFHVRVKCLSFVSFNLNKMEYIDKFCYKFQKGNQCFLIVFHIKSTSHVNLYSFIYHIHYDMFRPVITAIIG